jgi:hypothetical protein
MEQFLKLLDGNPWINLVFLILAIASIVISVVFFLKGRKEKEPRFNSKVFTLIEDHVNKIDAVQIQYLGKPVKNLTLSKFALWNKGRETINQVDIAPQDLLRIEGNEHCTILGANICFEKNETNNFNVRCNSEQNIVEITFDYFANNEGVVIDVYHTGSGNAELKLQGTVKGVKSILKATGQERYAMDMLEKISKSLLKHEPKSTNDSGALLVLALGLAIISIPALVLDQVIRIVKKPPQEFFLESGE